MQHLHAVEASFIRACERDWALARCTPSGLLPNCAIDAQSWGAPRAEFDEAAQ